jgi:hypothetical protein
MLTGYRITSVGDESIAACAHNDNKDDNKKIKTTNNDCVILWGHKKKVEGKQI